MSVLWIDFETRSACDLKVHGAYNYAMDPTTEVLCLCYAFDDDPVETWIPTKNPSLNDMLRNPIPDRVRNFTGQIRAHNAAFERLIFKHVLGIDFAIEQFYCTATQARANCMPGSLGDVARFSGVEQKKDYRGAQLIRWLCIPDVSGKFNDDPRLLQELFDYCAQDVRAMRAVSKSLRDLSEEELYDYHVNERINDLGILVDVPLCLAAVDYAAQEKKEIEQLVQEITDGEITSVRSRKMCSWVFDRVGREAKKLMEIYDGGEKKISIDKGVRANLLQFSEERPDEVPPAVADVIQCADDLWASSVAKFKRMAELADFEDDRVRGAFVFAGGSATGRASSYGLQIHNLARKCAKDPDAVRDAMIKKSVLIPEFGEVVNEVLKSMIRPAFLPRPGYKLVIADWNAIEGRVNPWLSNTSSGEAKLQQYRDGVCPYCVNAANFYGVKYEEIYHEYKELKQTDRRSDGKIQELAFGFLGSIGSFKAFAGKNNKFTEEDMLRAVRVWRRNNTWAMEHGRTLERAYMRAMRNPGKEIPACRIVYLFDGTHLWYMLPSGRILCYPFAKIEEGSVTYAKASWKPAANAKEWPRGTLWPGLAVENCWSGDTKIITKAGLKSISSITHDDWIWDGFDWVQSDGAICNGKKETVQWLGERCTANHLIYDGSQWRAVIDMDERTTNGCLAWAQFLDPLRLSKQTASPETREKPQSGANAAMYQKYRRAHFAEKNLQRVLHAVRLSVKKPITTGVRFLTELSGRYGHIVSQARYLAAQTRSIRRMPTMGGGASESLKSGWETEKRGFATLKRYPDGIILSLTSIGLTITDITRRGIFAWFQDRKTCRTDASHRRLDTKVKTSLSQSSGVMSALSGGATTPWCTISKQENRGMRLPIITGEREKVFDILNCGPRHQYAVMTKFGPVIAHNCTQATANDILRYALRELDDLYYEIVAHIHDEIVVQVPEDQAEEAKTEIEKIMTTIPPWATGLPLAVEADIRSRYMK